MKEYFKYANGFVNLNNENLFLTNSGNWSETQELLEKSSKSIKQNNFKGFKIYFYYFFVTVLLGFGIFDILRDIKNRTFPFGIILLGLGAFAYLKRETGKRYKIPISKIISITIIENSAKIVFLNENSTQDFEEINGVEAKGISVLEKLNSIIKADIQS